MAHRVQMGVPLTFFHPVRDLELQYVASQAASVTQSLLGPDRLAASETAILSDYATGWVQVTITLTEVGEYTLILTNPSPPTADGRVQPYTIVVTAAFSATENLLTSVHRVRTKMHFLDANNQPLGAGESHVFDDMITLLISEVSDEYQEYCGRTFAAASYTEYLDGSGRSSLVLGAGPLVSVTSLESVEYEDDDAGGVTETKTTIARHTYVLAGLRSQPRYRGRGRIDYLGSTVFTRGPKRYRVVYTAGFDAIPETIVGLATTDVVYRLMTRDTGHLLTQALGDGSISYLRPQQMFEARETGLSPWVMEAA